MQQVQVTTTAPVKTTDLGNILDAAFKKPWLALVHEGQDFFSEDAKGLQAQAESDIDAAKAAVAKAALSHEAAIQATVNPIVNQVVDSISGDVPVVGGLLKGNAEKAADAGTDAVIHGIIGWLSGFLSGK